SEISLCLKSSSLSRSARRNRLDTSHRRFSNSSPIAILAKLAQAARHPLRRLFSGQESRHVDTTVVRAHLRASRSGAALRDADLFAQHHVACLPFAGGLLRRRRTCHW